MKQGKKVLALALAVVLMLAMSVTAFAADDGTITVKTNFKGQTYKLYKLFDAVTAADRVDGGEGISYKLMSGKTDFKATPTGGTEIDGSRWFKVDSAGNVTLADGVTTITFDETFKQWAEAYGVKTGDDKTAASDNDANVKWTGLGEGYYFITTTTGSLVTVDSIKPNVEVNDKNTVPSVDKTITGASNISDAGKKALAQIGTDVEYTAVITVGKGSKNLKFHDKMDTDLTFKGNENVTVTSDASPALADGWYTIQATPDTGDTLTITFKDGIPEGTKITVKYLATINANALTKLENDAKVTYGDSNTSTAESKTETYNAQIAVIKYDGDKPVEGSETQAKYLAGAGFILARDVAAQAAVGNPEDADYQPAVEAHKEYYKLTGTTVSWVTDEAEADVHTSAAADGKVPAFTGLAAGTYTLIEKVVPAGYNQAADTTVTIAAGDYTEANLSQTKEIENHSGTELPSTGGIGTTIFYIVGAILVIGAGVLLITRRRMRAE